MDLKLRDKTVLITGSSKGIGKAIAEAFYREGCNVAINSRDKSELELVAESIGKDVSTHVADVTKIDECQPLVDSVVDKWNGLDILVCNVGNSSSVLPGNETENEWCKMMELNLYSTTNMVHAAQNALMKNNGSIVCISSICGLATLGAPVTYSVAKSALNSYVRGIAKPLAIKGIRINAIAPGNIYFKNGIWDKKIKEDQASVEKMLSNSVPLRRFGHVEEIANFSLFLASPIAGFSTGAIHVVDGGQIC